MDKLVETRLSLDQLYAQTGIQKVSYNTIYQLMALQQDHPEQLEKAEWLLMTPDYYFFLLP